LTSKPYITLGQSLGKVHFDNFFLLVAVGKDGLLESPTVNKFKYQFI